MAIVEPRAVLRGHHRLLSGHTHRRDNIVIAGPVRGSVAARVVTATTVLAAVRSKSLICDLARPGGFNAVRGGPWRGRRNRGDGAPLTILETPWINRRKVIVRPTPGLRPIDLEGAHARQVVGRLVPAPLQVDSTFLIGRPRRPGPQPGGWGQYIRLEG